MADALLVSPSFLPGRGGIESYLAELCAELRPRLAVLAPARRDGRELPEDLGYTTIGYAGTMLAPTRQVVEAIEHAARSQGTRRVLLGTPFPLAYLGPALARRGLRYAQMVHGAELLAPAAIPGSRRLLQHALAHADVLLAVSDYTANQLHALLGAPAPPIEVLRPRVDTARFRPDVDVALLQQKLSIPQDVRVIASFGRLVRRKGVHRLIDVLPEINRRAGATVLLVGGTGPEEARLRRRAEQARAPVIFAGRVSDDDAPALYALADLFCLPVTDRWLGLEVEGLGVVLLEASAAGTPCVTGRSGGTPEAVLDQETGFVVDATDPRQLADAVVALLTDDRRRQEMGRAARAHVRARFAERPLPDALSGWLAT